MPLKPASETRGRREVIYHLFVWAVKKNPTTTTWHVSIQVLSRGSHINNKHQLSIRCRQMKAVS